MSPSKVVGICAYRLPNVDYGQASLKTCWPRPQCQEGLTGWELQLQLLTGEGRCPWQTGSEKLPIFGSWWQPSVRQGCGRIAQVLAVTLGLGGVPESEDTTALWANCPSCHTRSSIAGYHSGLGGRQVDLILTVLRSISPCGLSEIQSKLGPRANLCRICRGRKYA